MAADGDRYEFTVTAEHHGERVDRFLSDHPELDLTRSKIQKLITDRLVLVDGQDVTKVSIFMNVFNVHVNRVPFDCKVLDQFYNKGRFLNASLDKASLENEQAGMLLETDSGIKVLCVQIAGLVARRIVSYPENGDHLKRGQRYGLIRFGSRVDLYFPEGVEVLSRIGDKTVAGESELGYLS
jgi:phosphatidylserine decarboxylase